MLGRCALGVIASKRSLSFARTVNLSILRPRGVLSTIARNPTLLITRSVSSKTPNLPVRRLF